MTSTVQITRINKNQSSNTDDQLAVEEPLQIQILYGPSGQEQTRNIAITMRTPGNDVELAAGFLFTEGIVQNKNQLINIIPEASGVNTVLAIFKGQNSPATLDGERNFYISSSCGVCGKSSIDALKKQTAFSSPVKQMSVKAGHLYALPTQLRNGQRLFHTTGGLHACALFEKNGQLVALREDVGRHNALDKLIGALFLDDRIPSADVILLLSGRASFELVQKAAMAGVQVVAAIGAPSSLAVELAIESGITLIGFLKEDQFNIYSCAERIIKS
jgi:FdhD protein